MALHNKAWLLAGLLVFSGAAHATATNLLVNGSFEDISSFVPNSDDSMSILPGSNVLHGWNILNSGGFDVALNGPTNPWGLYASQGSYYVDLAGYHGHTPWSGLSQTFSTNPGQYYTVTFDLGHYGNSPSMLQASAGNVSDQFTTNTGTTQLWDHEGFTFKANSIHTTLTLQGLSASNGNYLAIDNVAAVAAVPEPETYALMLGGLAVVALWRRRKWGGGAMHGMTIGC